MLATSILSRDVPACPGTYERIGGPVAGTGSLCNSVQVSGYKFYPGLTWGVPEKFFDTTLDEPIFPPRVTSSLSFYDHIPDFRSNDSGVALAQICSLTEDCMAGFRPCIPCLGFSTKHGLFDTIQPQSTWFNYTGTPCHGLYLRDHDSVRKMSRAVKFLVESDQSMWDKLFGVDTLYPSNMIISRAPPTPQIPLAWGIAVNISHQATFGTNETELIALGPGWDIYITCTAQGSYSTLPPLYGSKWQLKSLTVRGCNIPGTLPAPWTPPAQAIDFSNNRLYGNLPTFNPGAFSRTFTCLNLSNNYFGGHLPDGPNGWLVEAPTGSGPNLFDVSGNKFGPLRHQALERVCLDGPASIYFSRESAEATYPSLIHQESEFLSYPFRPICHYWGGGIDPTIIAAGNAIERTRGTRYAIGRSTYDAKEFPRNLCTNPAGLIAVAVMFCVAGGVLISVAIYKVAMVIIGKRRGMDKNPTCRPWETRGERPNIYALLVLAIAIGNLITDSMVLAEFSYAHRWGSFGPGVATTVVAFLIFGISVTEHLTRAQTAPAWQTTRRLFPISWIPVAVVSLIAMFPRCIRRNFGPWWSQRIDPAKFVRLLGLTMLPENCCMLALQSYMLSQGNALGNRTLINTPLIVIAILFGLMSLTRTVTELILDAKGSLHSLGSVLSEDGFHHGMPADPDMGMVGSKDIPLTDLGQLRPGSAYAAGAVGKSAYAGALRPPPGSV